jgi:hypothetical protein
MLGDEPCIEQRSDPTRSFIEVVTPSRTALSQTALATLFGLSFLPLISNEIPIITFAKESACKSLAHNLF